MTTAQLTHRLRGNGTAWLQSVRDAMRGERGAWLFVAKAMLSMYLAVGLAMALELPSPSMSMLTVLVVMNSQSGMVMAKSFYRILGTLLGVSAAVMIVAAFPQQPVLMLAAIALWSGMCAAGAQIFKGFRGYTFVLSGYTVAMIVLPVVNTPEAIFEVAVHRFIEVLLGLAVTTLVFDGLFPVQLSAQVRALAQGNRQYLLEQVQHVLSAAGKPLPELHAESSRKAIGFEDLLNNAVFEGPWLSSISRPLKRSNHYFMQTLTRLQAFYRLQQRSAGQFPQVHSLLRQLSAPLPARLDSDSRDHALLVPDLQQIAAAIGQQKAVLRQQLPAAEQALFDTGAALLTQMLKSLIRCLHTLALARPAENSRRIPATRFSRTYDPVMVMLSMARTSLITFVVGLLWIASGWSSGATGMFIVVALSMMLAPLPNPLAAVRLAAAGHTVAPFLALLCFSILPSLTTFPLLVTGTAPFLLVMLYIVTRPGWAGFAVPLNFGFMVALNIGHSPATDYVYFFNEMLAAITGVALAASGFLLFPGVNGSHGQLRRFKGFLDDSVRLAATASLPHLAEHLESRNRDISVQMLTQLPPGSEQAAAFLRYALLVQETCYVLTALREDLNDAGTSNSQKQMIADVVQIIADHWQPGGISARGHTRLNTCLALALNDNGTEEAAANSVREHLYLLADVLDEQLSQAAQPSEETRVAY